MGLMDAFHAGYNDQPLSDEQRTAETRVLTGENPDFKDPTRDVLGYASLNEWRGLYGFEPSTQFFTAPVTKSVAEGRDWIKDGFTPTNQAFATAGTDGSYIGAIPVSSLTPEKEGVKSISMRPISLEAVSLQTGGLK